LKAADVFDYRTLIRRHTAVASDSRSIEINLDAERRLFIVRRDVANARHAYLLARIQLKYYAGFLSEQHLRALAGYFQPSA